MSSWNFLNRFTLGNIIYYVATFLITWSILLFWGLASWALRQLTFVVTSHQMSQLEEQFHALCSVTRRRLWILSRCRTTHYKLKEELTVFLSVWARCSQWVVTLVKSPLTFVFWEQHSSPGLHLLKIWLPQWFWKDPSSPPFQFLITMRLGMTPCFFASYKHKSLPFPSDHYH